MTVSASQLADEWLRLWNGDPHRAPDLLTPDFQVHVTTMDASDGSFSGVDKLVAWIESVRAAFTSLVYTLEVGPVAQDDLLAFRWSVAGTYGGGIPGATAEPGTPVTFTGIDLLRVVDARLAEYWSNSDLHVMSAQLKMVV